MSLMMGGILWALAATAVAMLPMRFQFVPGFILLLMAPVLIYQLGHEYGRIFGIAALTAFISMFRKPLAYYAGKLFNRQAPEEPE